MDGLKLVKLVKNAKKQRIICVVSMLNGYFAKIFRPKFKNLRNLLLSLPRNWWYSDDSVADMRNILREKIMKIREIRDVTGLTQVEFAKKCNIPKRTIENWESGHSKCPDYIPALLERCITQNLYVIPLTREPIKNLRKKTKMSRVAFAQKYNIPLRTLEDWEYERRRCPEYVFEMIERCVRHDILPIYFCVFRKKHINKFDKKASGWNNLIFYRHHPHNCIPENISAKFGYSSIRTCKVGLKRAKKDCEKSNKYNYNYERDFEPCIMTAEEIFELLSQISQLQNN